MGGGKGLVGHVDVSVPVGHLNQDGGLLELMVGHRDAQQELDRELEVVDILDFVLAHSSEARKSSRGVRRVSSPGSAVRNCSGPIPCTSTPKTSPMKGSETIGPREPRNTTCTYSFIHLACSASAAAAADKARVPREAAVQCTGNSSCGSGWQRGLGRQTHSWPLHGRGGRQRET